MPGETQAKEKHAVTPVRDPEPNPEASRHDVTVLTTAPCHPSLFFSLYLSFKHQIQFVFSPSTDLMGFHIRL